jgi:hypothetical protein
MVTENKRMFQRRRTAAQWTSENPVLGAGEIGIISDDVPAFKIGDGTTAWNSLNTNPDLASSDTAKMSLSTAGGVTTLNVEKLAPEWARLTANSTAVNNSTTLVNVTGLSVPVAANAVYYVTGLIFYSTPTAADIKFAFTTPASSSGRWQLLGFNTGGTTVFNSVHSGTSAWTATNTATGGLDATEFAARPVGLLVTAGTAGTLQAQFAQNTATATDSTINAHSFIRAERLA